MTAARCVAVTVTFNPDLAILRRQFKQLGATPVVVVDNGSNAAVREALEACCGAPGQPSIVFSSDNRGLAAGLNLGAREALRREPGCDYLLFLDQDTEPGAGGVEYLVAAADALRRSEPRLGVAGPLMVDVDSGLSHGVHVIRGWRWTRLYPDAGCAALRCDSVNGSGSLVPAAVFRELGGFDESLFIDHVDTEWSFRVVAAGYRLYTLPGVRFAHRMGERSLRFWLGRWRVWPHRSPLRQFYLFRNAVLLMRRPYPPVLWKAWATAKLAVTLAVHFVFDRDRRRQVRAMFAGIGAGWRREGGAVEARRLG